MFSIDQDFRCHHSVFVNCHLHTPGAWGLLSQTERVSRSWPVLKTHEPPAQPRRREQSLERNSYSVGTVPTTLGTRWTAMAGVPFPAYSSRPAPFLRVGEAGPQEQRSHQHPHEPQVRPFVPLSSPHRQEIPNLCPVPRASLKSHNCL